MTSSTLRQLRRVHNYLAVFFAPAILFFAFTGGLQTTELFDRHGDAPPAPRWIAAIMNLHKHQVVGGPRRRPPAAAAAPAAVPGAPATPAAARPGGDHDEHDRGFNPLKPFVLLLSIALFVTTALGMAIAIGTRSTRRLSIILTVAGVVVPLLLLL